MTVLLLGIIILLQTTFLGWLISRNPKVDETEEPVLRVSDLPVPAHDLPTKGYVDGIGTETVQQMHDSFVSLSEALFQVVDEQEEWLKGRLKTTNVRAENAEDLASNLIDVVNASLERVEALENRLSALETVNMHKSSRRITNVANTTAPAPVVAETLVERIEETQMVDTPEEPTEASDGGVERIEPTQEDAAPLKEIRGENDPMITDLRAVPFDADPSVRADAAFEGHHDLPPMTGDYEIMGSAGPSDAQRRAADRARRGVRGFRR